jgi:tetratricopeptide (TPR) repeat protein
MTLREQRLKKDEYQKALAAFGQAAKEFHKGDFDKAAVSFKDFIEKYPAEKEVVDRAKAYLAVIQNRSKKDHPPLKAFEDYYRFAVTRLNQKDYPGAIKSLEKALEYKEQEGLVHYLLADAHCLLGQADDALDLLKKAVQKDKQFGILAQNEPDFETLWEDKKFKLITKLV